MSASRRVVTITKEQKAESRRVVLRLQQSVQNEFEKQLEKTKREIEESGMGADEIDDFVDRQFDVLNKEFQQRSDELKVYVKSKKPTKPTSNDPKEKAEYDEKVEEYKSFVEYSVTIISRLTDFIKEVFLKIKEFFRSLWNWIKSKFQDVAKKVGEFVAYMKEKFGGLVDFIFG